MPKNSDEERRAKRVEQQRRYRATHPVSEKEKKRAKEYARAWRARPENRERLAAKARQRRLEDPQKLSEEARAKRGAKSRAYYAKNREKAKARSRRYWATHPEAAEKQRQRKLREPEKIKQQQLFYTAQKRSKRIALADRPQAEVCDICGSKDRRIVFDHCHKQGHFRGWLCDRCNRVLGFTDDSPELLLAMASYLKRTRTNTSPQLTLPGV